MSQMQIQVADADNKLYLLVEQAFDAAGNGSMAKGLNLPDQPPQYLLTDLEGHFLWDVIKLPDGTFAASSGSIYRPVGT